MGDRLKVGGGLVVMTAVIAAVLTVGGPGIDFTCDTTVSEYGAMAAEMNDATNAGKVVCVDADIQGSPDNAAIRITTAFASNARFIAKPPNGTIRAPSIVFDTGAENVTLEGFEFTDENGVGMAGGINNVRVVRNYAHDQHLDFISGNGCESPKTNVEILGNRIRAIQFDGEFPHGYGIFGACFDGLKINYNECDGASDGTVNVMGDCWEISQTDNFENIGNWIHDLRCSACGETHTDGIQWWSGSTNGVVRDNVLDGFAQNTISPDGQDVIVDNNLIVDGQGNCFDVHPNGSSGDIQPLRYTFTNNTIWGCGFEAISMNSTVAEGRGDNEFIDNIFEDGSCASAGLSVATGNIIAADDAALCGLSGSTNHVTGWVPNWNLTNTGSHPTYQAINKPLGYEGAGYQPAPYGPNACPC